MQKNLFSDNKCPYCGRNKVLMVADKEGVCFFCTTCLRVSPKKPTREEAEKAAFGCSGSSR